MFSSGFVVLRAQYEAVVRAVWALYSASDEHIARISGELNLHNEKDAKSLPQAWEMLASLSSIQIAKVPFNALTEFRDSAWQALNSYVHAGIHPLSRMTGGYPMDLVINNVKVSNALAMLAAMQFCILTGIDGLQKQLSPLHEKFNDCLPMQHGAIRQD
jgi:hypothetical protein